MKKRIFSLLMSLVMVISLVEVIPTTNQLLSDKTIVAKGYNMWDNIQTYGDYKYAILPNKTIQIIKYNGSKTELNIPSTIKGKKVTIIGQAAFSYNPKLKKVKIPNSITKIEPYAFIGTDLLEKQNTSVKYINDWAIHCDNVASATVKSSTKKIADGCFMLCKNLKKVSLPQTITSIGGSAFEWCKKLTEINIPKKVTTIEPCTFAYCTSLKKVYLNNVKKIGWVAFFDCNNIKSLTIPKSVKSIDKHALGFYTNSSGNEVKNKNFKIKCYKSTAGEKYAKSNGIKYELILDKVSNLNATSISTNSIKLKWSKVSGAKGYVVYQKKSGKWSRIKVTASNSYTVSKLKSGTTYQFCVKPYTKSGTKTIYGNASKTLTTSTNPATVSFKLTAGTKKVSVKWSKVTGASGYKVYYKTSKNGSWKTLKTCNNKTTSYTKTKLTKGKTYYFTVKAYRKLNGKTYNGSYTTKSIKSK